MRTRWLMLCRLESSAHLTQLCCLAYRYRASPKSMLINGSSPTTHASCPGGIDPTSPGPNSASEPSSIRTTIRPEMTWIRWPTWQLSVPTAGLTHSDPTPSRFMDHALDLDTAQVHDLDLALVQGSCFFRGIKALFHHLCHLAPPIQLLQILHPVRAEIQAALFCPQAPRTDQPIVARCYPLKKKSVDFFCDSKNVLLYCYNCINKYHIK